jgi:hypothetical protein
MYVVVHKDPGIDGTFSLNNILAEALKKARFVFIVVKYVGLVDAPHHDMVQGSGYVQSRLSWHGGIVLQGGGFVKLIAC